MDGPRPHYFYVITTLSAVMVTIGLLISLYIIPVLGSELPDPNVLPLKYYKGFMCLTVIMFTMAAATGIWVYSTWYASIPEPPGS
jgi:hypothetical protein